MEVERRNFMKFKRIVSSLLISTMLFSSSVFANEIPIQDYQAEVIRRMIAAEDFSNLEKEESDFGVSALRETIDFTDNLGSIENILSEQSEVGELQILEDADIIENEASDNTIGIQPFLSNSYYWNYRTAVFEPSRMSSTSDIDIVWDRYQQPGNQG